MKTVAVNKKFLRDFKDKPLDPHLVDPALCRHMRLVEVVDVDNVGQEFPELVDLSLYLLLYRDGPHGREVAAVSEPAPDGYRNFYGDWFSLDEKDWDNFTIHSDFNITYMLNLAVRNILTDPLLEGIDLHTTHSYGIVDMPGGSPNDEMASIYAAIAVQIPSHVDLPVDWVVVTHDFPILDLMTLPRKGDDDAPGAATH